MAIQIKLNKKIVTWVKFLVALAMLESGRQRLVNNSVLMNSISTRKGLSRRNVIFTLKANEDKSSEKQYPLELALYGTITGTVLLHLLALSC